MAPGNFSGSYIAPVIDAISSRDELFLKLSYAIFACLGVNSWLINSDKSIENKCSGIYKRKLDVLFYSWDELE